eukprot:TRINITY_DN58027_c0_g1_i1.p1 TRINITY_DN58027_c0_g1~~TRINITY_DN58027_c0_g1_i1.p1  ORF type:complete len:338 (+),score=61.57 TRINITY_DN58027_c0_g1_i1:90-1103(+)
MADKSPSVPAASVVATSVVKGGSFVLPPRPSITVATAAFSGAVVGLVLGVGVGIILASRRLWPMGQFRKAVLGISGGGGCQNALERLKSEVKRDDEDDGSRHGAEGARPQVLLIGTGSVASVKVPELVAKLAEFANVLVVLSPPGARIVFNVAPGYAPSWWEAWERLRASGRVQLFVDEDEWDGYKNVNENPVLHIELVKRADCVVVAPCSANTLAKAAFGLSDNLATCILRAWSPDTPLLIAPAMNTVMWEHPATSEHLKTIQLRGGHVVPPVAKRLACGDVGRGALASVDVLVTEVRNVLATLEQTGGNVARMHVGAWARNGFFEWDNTDSVLSG